MATEVLGLDEFDAEVFENRITVIEARDNNTLVFCFAEGTTCVKRWQHRSRADSWTPEMKNAARKRVAEQERPQRGWHGYFQKSQRGEEE